LNLVLTRCLYPAIITPKVGFSEWSLGALLLCLGSYPRASLRQNPVQQTGFKRIENCALRFQATRPGTEHCALALPVAPFPKRPLAHRAF
jgi:hypothetical protein